MREEWEVGGGRKGKEEPPPRMVGSHEGSEKGWEEEAGKEEVKMSRKDGKKERRD